MSRANWTNLCLCLRCDYPVGILRLTNCPPDLLQYTHEGADLIFHLGHITRTKPWNLLTKLNITHYGLDSTKCDPHFSLQGASLKDST